MAKFIYLYRGPATPMSDFTPEQGAERMAAFGAWMEKVGAALVDVGSPFGTSASVRDDGTEGTAGDLIGYTIVEADDLAAAKGRPRHQESIRSPVPGRFLVSSSRRAAAAVTSSGKGTAGRAGMTSRMSIAMIASRNSPSFLHLGLPPVPGRRWLRGARPDPGKFQRGRQPGGLLRHAQALTCSRLSSAAKSAAARPEAHPSSSVARLPRS